MNVGTFFSLRNAISLSTRGRSGILYYFSKGKPVAVVREEDIELFRSKSELFECDIFGNPIQTTAASNKPISFVKINPRDNFVPNSIPKLFNDDKPEETIKDALNPKLYDYDNDPDVKKRLEQIKNGELTEAQKLAMGIEVDDEEDGIKKKNEVKTKPIKKSKIPVSTKNGKFKCEKCGKKFAKEEELNDHMEIHDLEDD
ncbi:C2H2-type zinc finger protein [Thermosipho sp. (in: thermotogales)]|uniref:C2H2-type zinc finger protein n=1 Tax=Thermosipho sp. (in: thermotogales) TaxID=1968895 RepID=UPI00257D8F15|nr:C2H2-type zinc finger protein [Thermosipho sp. (in: thermotogales)]MBZ4649187.1 hypothetical protein [Thermosipho sp. (in: thermotogales)]